MISSQTIDKILECSFISKDYESVMCEANQETDVMIDDITNYQDVFNMSSTDSKTSLHIYKDKKNKKNYMMCFPPTTEMARFRPVKQKLADVTTSYVIQRMRNTDYEAFLRTFYVPTRVIIEKYAEMHQLSVPSDVCFFYKGGNLYKILLNELLPLFGSGDFDNLLKRSDADFGLFINPKIPNYTQVFKDLSILITYSLCCFKKILKTNDFNMSSLDSAALLKNMTNELNDNKISYKSVELITDRTRNDFMLNPITIDGSEYIMYKEVPCLLEGMPNPKPSPFYISRNTAIEFKRKDGTFNSFDLIRMKLNVKLKVDGTLLNVPSEVIDVGISKQNDTSIPLLKSSAAKCFKQYNYSNKDISFQFWGPTLSYMIKDIDQILFYQNEFPWHDKKTSKRVQRYFLCIILHTIVSSSIDDPISKLNILKQEFKRLIKFLTCFNENSQCEVGGAENISGLFHVKYKTISTKLNQMRNIQARANELRDFHRFNAEIILVLKNILKNILYLLANTHASTLNHMKKKIMVLNATSYLGGKMKHNSS